MGDLEEMLWQQQQQVMGPACQPACGRSGQFVKWKATRLWGIRDGQRQEEEWSFKSSNHSRAAGGTAAFPPGFLSFFCLSPTLPVAHTPFAYLLLWLNKDPGTLKFSPRLRSTASGKSSPEAVVRACCRRQGAGLQLWYSVQKGCRDPYQ